MTGPHLPGPDALAGIDALVTDRYLDALLAAAERSASATPTDAVLDGDLREATDVLRRSLVRVHPSFRFEERLAAQLAALAADADENRGANVIAFRQRASADAVATDPLLAAILDGTLDPADAEAVACAEGLPGRNRPLIVGGALTSAAISLVGVALVAWRASHTDPRSKSASAMARAVRTAHQHPLRKRRADVLAASGAGGPA